MPPDDGLTEAQLLELERAADALLLEDARRLGFIRPSGRGYTKYARSIGIVTRDVQARTYLHEKVGFDDRRLDELAHESPTKAHQRRLREVRE